MQTLTHAGGDLVEPCLQRAAALGLVVRDVRLQEGNAKLPLVDHADQAASGPARSLAFRQNVCGKVMRRGRLREIELHLPYELT